MPGPSQLDDLLRNEVPPPLRAAVDEFLATSPTREQRIAKLELALSSPFAPMLRDAIGNWIVDRLVPASKLVPTEYKSWIPVVRDAMMYVIKNHSAPRLAPKIIEQLELPLRTRTDTRLLCLISKVPGLQKLGQVIARNRHLRPPLRRSLMKLENGIRDVEPAEIRLFISQQLERQLQQFEVKVERRLISEASVSSIARFRWTNPETGLRERGVFKVLKPYIPVYFAEDMGLLQGLTDHFSSKMHDYGFSSDVLSDTFMKVRLLLQHEVDFAGEQETLSHASGLYRGMSHVRVPTIIAPMCTPQITAMTEEVGLKVTTALKGMSTWKRSRLAEQMVEALVAVPLLSSDERVLFHADPHAGNILFDRKTGKLVILDWALAEWLTLEQRRHLALLFVHVALRDHVGTIGDIDALRQPGSNGHYSSKIEDIVTEHLNSLPWAQLPSAVDAMRLVEKITLAGVRFPAALIMLSKVMFTLDGILYDFRVSQACVWIGFLRHLSDRTLNPKKFAIAPLRISDLARLPLSATFYACRLWIASEEQLANRLFRRRQTAVTTT